ncbi:MAG: hypothetical protein AAGN82_27810 [Myxococcota bacterium]
MVLLVGGGSLFAAGARGRDTSDPTPAPAPPADPRAQLRRALDDVEHARYRAALAAVDAMQDQPDTALVRGLIRARALRGLGRDAPAFRALEQTAAAFPDEDAPKLELLALCRDLGLRARARHWATELLAGRPTRPRVMTVLEALYDDAAALPLLERAAAPFHEDGDVLYRLAHAYAAARHRHAAGTLFARAAQRGRAAAFEAADQFRLAGATRRALRLNARVADETKRLRQRVRILSDAQRFARTVALEAEARRLGIDDPNVRYRFAYARFRLGQEDRATELARALVGTEVEDPATALLRALGRPLEVSD